MAMVNFNFGRVLMSAMALGIAGAAYEDALEYAKGRVQFEKPIFEFRRSSSCSPTCRPTWPRRAS